MLRFFFLDAINFDVCYALRRIAGFCAQFGRANGKDRIIVYVNLNTVLGRWGLRDPIEFEGGLNLYNYAQNGPILNTDSYGLEVSGASSPEWNSIITDFGLTLFDYTHPDPVCDKCADDCYKFKMTGEVKTIVTAIYIWPPYDARYAANLSDVNMLLGTSMSSLQLYYYVYNHEMKHVAYAKDYVTRLRT